MKRFLSLLFATLFALTTWAYSFSDDSSGTTIYYDIVDGGVEVTYGGYEGDATSSYTGALTIPSTASNGGQEYTVIGIADDAFDYCKLTTLTLPNTIQHIGWSFYYSEVQEVVFLDGVTSLTLDAYAFQYATNLTSINLPSVLTAIPTGGFDNCTSLASIEIPAAVTSIGGNAFRRCPLTSVTCFATTPPTCQSTTFNNVTLSDVVLNVPCGSEDEYAAAEVWSGFGTISGIDCEDEGTPLEDGATFEYDGLNYKVVSSADLNVEVTGSGSTPSSYSGDIVIPESATYDNVTYHVVGIGDNAFYVGTSVTGLTIANSVEYIGAYAFYNCSQVKSIEVPSSVTSIGQYAFQMCSGVTSMSITGVDAIADGLFYSCSALESVELPASVSSMGKEVFRGCSKLASVTLPDGVTTLGSYSFYSCSALTSITIPASVTTIDTYAFQSSGLVNISFAEGSVLTTIGNYAFYGTKLEAIEIPASVETIGNNAFYNCTSLTSVVIPDKVTKLGQSAFQGCSALEEVTLGESVSDMSSDGIFYGCSKLLSVTSLNPEPPTCASTVFASATTSDGTLYVPCDSKDAYAGASTWSSFANIEGIDCEDEGTPLADGEKFEYDGLKYLVVSSDERTVKVTYSGNDTYTDSTYSGDIEIPSTFSYENVTYTVVGIGEYAFRGSSMTSLIIPETVTFIENYAFRGCSQITSLVLPDGLTSLGESVFDSCSSLASINIPDGITELGYSLFYSCSALASVTMSNNVVSTAMYTFYKCTSLESIDLSTSLEVIGQNCFYGCSALKSIAIPASVTTINGSAFYNCSGLESVTFGEGIELSTMGTDVFYGCSVLANINLPESLTTIPNNTFYQCYALADVTIGANVTSIGTYSFRQCTSLKSIEIPASVQTIGSSFYMCSGLETVTFAEGSELTSIDGNGFYQCTSLKSIVLPDKLETIGRSAFQGCSSLAEVTIGESVTKLNDGVFYQCYSPMTVTALPTTPPSCGESVFDSATTSNGILYVPCDSKDAYAEASTWKNFANIEGIDCEDEGGHGYSADDPFEVSEVIALAETLSSSDTVEGVYVKGIVSQIGSFYSNYGDLDYYISDDGTTDNQFYIYNGYYLDGEKFTSADQIKVTDTVIVTGDLTNYQGNTPELARGSKIVYLEEGEGVEGGSDGSVSASGSTVTLTNNGVTVGTETATIDFTTLGLSDAEDVSGRAFELSDGSTVTFAQNGGATSPKYYDVSTAIRAYALNTATFAASKQIAKIEMTCASSSYTGNTTATVEFSETGAVYCNDHTQNSGGTQLRVQSLVVYYAEDAEEGGIPTGYILDPADESEVETLSTIKISLESGSLSLNSYDAQGVVMSKTGGQVATVSFTDDYDDELQVGYCIATLSEDISEMGTYYVTFPAGVFFDFGTFESNPEFTATYYVTGPTSTTEYTFDPEDGSTLGHLSEFTVGYADGINCSWNYTKDITVTNEAGDVVAKSDDCEDNWPDNWDDPCVSCTITLDATITAAGNYTINIPEGYFVVGSNYLNSEALTIHYTVDGSEDVSYELVVDPESGETLESLSEFTITCEDGLSLNSWDPLYVKKDDVVVAHAWGDDPVWADNGSVLGYIFTICDPDTEADLTLTDAGEYTIEVPEGYFLYDNESESEGFTIVYTIEDNRLYTIEPEEGVVESLSSVKFIAIGNIAYAEVVEPEEIKVYKDGDTSSPVAYGVDINYAAKGIWDEYDEIVFNTELTDPGEYSVVIPEAFLALGDWFTYSEEMTLNYTIEKQLTFSDYYTLDPEEGVVESLSHVKFTAVEGMKMAWRGYGYVDADEVKVYKDGDTTTAVAYGASVTAVEDGSYDSSDDIFFNVTLTDPGEYEVVFPYNSFVYNNNGRTPSPEFSLHYTIEESFSGWGVPSGYIVDPDDESYVETLSTIKISLESGSLTLNSYDAQGVVMSKTGGQVATVSFTDDYDDELQVGYIIATLSEEISDMGTYYVTFPAGAFFDFGALEANPEFTVTYYVTGSGDEGGSEHEYSIDPAEGVQSSLQKFTLYTPDGVCADEYGSSEYDFTVYLYKDGASEPYASTSDIDSKFDTSVTWNGDCELYFTFAEAITEAGEYEFVIPANSFYWSINDGYDLEINKELRFSYTVDGSEAVEPGTFECVVDPGDKSSLEELAQVAFYNPTDGEEIFVNDELARDPEIYVYNEAGDVVTTISYFDTIWDQYFTKEYAQIVVFEDAVTEGGTYTVSVPAEMFIIYDEDNRPYYSEAMTLTYTVVGSSTGIGGISINDENVEGIYSTSGQKLNSTVKGVNIIRYSDGSVKKLYVK